MDEGLPDFGITRRCDSHMEIEKWAAAGNAQMEIPMQSSVERSESTNHRMLMRRGQLTMT